MRIAPTLGIKLNPDNWEEIWALLDKHREQKKADFLYAIVNWNSRMVKFGRSVNPGQRLKALQTSHGSGLVLFGYCPHESPFTEREVHERLAAHRLRGEWFDLNADTQAVIQQVRTQAGVL
jgi:hypothetical protein